MPSAKKRKALACFLSACASRPGVIASSLGSSFAFCRLCQQHFSVTHGDFNDVMPCEGKGAQETTQKKKLVVCTVTAKYAKNSTCSMQKQERAALYYALK